MVVIVQDAAAGLSPQSCATGVRTETNVVATFSECLRGLSVDGTTFVLVKKGIATRVPALVCRDQARQRHQSPGRQGAGKQETQSFTDGGWC